MFNEMDVRISFLLLISVVLLFDVSYGGSKRRQRKKNKHAELIRVQNPEESNKIKELEEDIKKLKEKVDKLPTQIVNIHVHKGDHEEEHTHKHAAKESITTGHLDKHHDHHDSHDHHKEHDHHKKHDHHKVDDHAGSHDHDEDHDEHDIHFYMHLVDGDGHHGKGHHHDEDEVIHAHCEVEPNRNILNGDDIHGHIHFMQKGHDPVDVHIQMDGFEMTKENPDMVHGFHVHAIGDMSNSCDSLGKHFNPHGSTHGAKDAKTRHVGDLGNIKCDMDGKIDMHMKDDKIALHGEHSIIGRSMTIHKTKDDLGLGGTTSSLSGGDAGPKVACCVIGFADPAKYEHLVQHHSTESIAAVAASISTSKSILLSTSTESAP